jgi:diguanylate cyclase (GGDEF)-like protein/PAS domain S-box-containing protein
MIAEPEAGLPFALGAFYASAGVLLYSAVEALFARYVARAGRHHLPFAALALCAAGMQVVLATFYTTTNPVVAVRALHWQITLVSAGLLLFYLFVAWYLGQTRRLGPALGVLAVLAVVQAIYDWSLPYGLHFDQLGPGTALELPWGERLGHFVGRSEPLRRLPPTGFYLAVFALLILGLARRARTVARERRLSLVACILLVAASAVWGSLIDTGVLRSVYVSGFALGAIVLLMSYDMARNQATFRRRLDLVLKGANDAWWDWDLHTGQQTYSARGWQLLGYRNEELPYDEHLWERLAYPPDRAMADGLIGAAIKARESTYSFEMRLQHRDGHPVPVLCRGYIERDRRGRAVRITGSHTDLTERKAAETEAYRLGYLDELTELPNRRMLIERLRGTLESARRSHRLHALLVLDVDDFKRINDARGHSVGDRLLLQLAQRLSTLLRTVDLVGRLGGDEFLVLVGDLGSDREAAARAAMDVAQRLREAVEQPFEIDGLSYTCSGSVGVTMFPTGAAAAEDLLREADTAMYRAKAEGRGRICYFEPGMQAEVEERLVLEQDLKQALAGAQIQVHAQPQFDAQGQVVGAELLLRWNHPTRGPVPPAQFIPIAEESDLIVALGQVVLERACAALARLEAVAPGLSVSVNLSPRQFSQADFVASVRAALAAAGAPAGRLVFEVTENLLAADLEMVAARMGELAALGLRFSIDDFGTGYSSLAYLRRLPLDELKIDRSFVQDVPADPKGAAMVRTILAIARQLGLKVVAEGVETAEQSAFLVAEGCDGFQGWFHARPMPLEQWLASLEARQAA